MGAQLSGGSTDEDNGMCSLGELARGTEGIDLSVDKTSPDTHERQTAPATRIAPDQQYRDAEWAAMEFGD
jgi:hypothetical protein